MAEFEVRFDSHPEPIRVPAGTLLVEVASQAGIEIQQPCGGQGRCGRCAVRVESGQVRRRSALRLSKSDIDDGYALACQTVVEGDAAIVVPPPEAILRRLTTDHIAPEAAIPEGYDASRAQSIQRVAIQLTPPSLDDQTDDWGPVGRRLPPGDRLSSGWTLLWIRSANWARPCGRPIGTLR